jgi:NAD(P)-dependent dehydrogenase (short-subunit alcohol dehydrogenase family)
MAVQVDVSDGEAVKSAIAEVLRKFGRIDAVHNNAGIATPSKPLHETSEAEWDSLQRNNVKSVYWTTRYAFEALRRSKEPFSTPRAWWDSLVSTTRHVATREP